ncbi:MAG: aldose 1-epimerase family protein [Limosilactobacillus sp.]|uniref:aldose 1-epimerase family protein n=1 Tax=Limosilactobacillus sp. TaxID=2773925 RepID=UPI0026F8FD03|nr:aldose 1-epimerase family protein [Limosilactobacillus sp.]
MITLHNESLTVEIDELGAQPHSIKRNDNGIEYLWQGDPASWKRQAPVLFPFVGRLKDNQYTFDGKTYHQSQHGFARERQFTVVDKTDDRVVLELHSDDESRKVFPFEFVLKITYKLDDDQLTVNYNVKNPGDRSLIYAIGAHPGFNVPVTADGTFENVELSVSPAEEYSRILLKPPYNDSYHPQLIDMTKPLAINHELFNDDAIIYKTAGSDFNVTLHDKTIDHGVNVSTKGTKYVGIWSTYPTEANFVCIEPWWGIADNVEADGLLLHKQDMSRLAPGQDRDYDFSIKPF